MKVLIYHYNTSDRGGAEQSIRDLMQALAGKGIETRLSTGADLQRDYADYQPDIVQLETFHCGPLGWGALEWVQGQGVPHVVRLHDYWPFCNGRMLLNPDGRPCDAVAGTCDPFCRFGQPLPRQMAMLNRSPLVTFNPYSEAIFERNGVRVKAMIPHGIDTALFQRGEKYTDNPTIVTSSAWAHNPAKGMDVLERALRGLPYEVGLITGLTRANVARALASADIYVFPSVYEETFGLCLAEAMASGCACVASNVAGARYQINHGVNGLLVAPGDSNALASAIRELVDDPDMRGRLGTAAMYKAALAWNLDRMARDYAALYEEVLGG